MRSLVDQLRVWFNDTSVRRVTLALTTEIDMGDHCQLVDENDEEAALVIGLGNSGKIKREFGDEVGNRNLRLFPIAFSRVACNMQSHGCPRVYEELSEPIIEDANEMFGGEDVVSIRSFQIYNTLKQQIRRNASGFLGGQSIVSGGLCRMASQGSVKDRRKQLRLVDKVKRGEPFKQIIFGCDDAMSGSHVRTRIEPVVSIDMSQIVDEDGEDRFESEGERWNYVVRSIVSRLFGAMQDNVEKVCFRLLDIYSTGVSGFIILYLTIGFPCYLQVVGSNVATCSGTVY